MDTTLHPGPPETAGVSPERIRRVSQLARSWVEEEKVQSIVVLVARRGRIVLHEAFGRLRPEQDSPATPRNAIFPLASINKVIVATALMTLVEEGRVGLNRPVSSYLPEFEGAGKDAVLVRHLLTHTSGLRGENLEKFAAERRGKVEIPPTPAYSHPLVQRWIYERIGCPLWKPPGQEMSYSSFGFELLAEIIRRVSRTAVDEFARTRLFAPLGMNDTFLCRVDAPEERRIHRPPDPDNPPDEVDIAAEKERLSMAWGYGLSTALDMAIFGQMFLNHGAYGGARILSPASAAAMTRNQIPGVSSHFFAEVFPEASWGLGWSVHGSKTGACGALYSSEAYEHWGGGGGSYVWVDPTYDLVGVYFAVVPVLLGSNTSIVSWAKSWRNDLFTDAATAAITEL